jgi:hypothetical protein
MDLLSVFCMQKHLLKRLSFLHHMLQVSLSKITEWEKISASYISDKGLITKFYILYSYLKQIKSVNFFKNRDQEGKIGPIWGVGTSGRGKI